MPVKRKGHAILLRTDLSLEDHHGGNTLPPQMDPNAMSSINIFRQQHLQMDKCNFRICRLNGKIQNNTSKTVNSISNPTKLGVAPDAARRAPAELAEPE